MSDSKAEIRQCKRNVVKGQRRTISVLTFLQRQRDDRSQQAGASQAVARSPVGCTKLGWRPYREPQSQRSGVAAIVLLKLRAAYLERGSDRRILQLSATLAACTRRKSCGRGCLYRRSHRRP